MNSVRKAKGNRFKSYINNPLGDYEERAVDVPEEPEVEIVEPFLFPDEVIIAEAQNVLKFAPLKANKSGLSGTLFVTNFKLSFVTTSLVADEKEVELHCSSLQSDYLGLHDICLTEIDSIYHLMEGGKKKRLCLSNPIPSKIRGLNIILKNFRSINFSFRFTPPLEDVKVTKAMLVHRSPATVDLFHLTVGKPSPCTGIPEFTLAQEWERELKRTRCQNWRVCKTNEFFNHFPSLPSTFVVPQGVTDNDLELAAAHFRGLRPPVWSWGTSTGAAIIRMAHMSPTVTATDIENHLIRVIHLSHPQRIEPTIMDLDQQMANIKQIQISYQRLMDLHTPDTINAFHEGDKNYYSRWQHSGWLTLVEQSLYIAHQASTALSIQNSSVILQENEGRDTSCLISSLIQILLDPYTRTLRGFHTLIQKEWVTLGHPFCMRLGHTKQLTEDQSPIWLLFLDCVRQIAIQHSSSFEFTIEYLSALWLSTHCSLHSTFMFNCAKDQIAALNTIERESRLPSIYLHPVWSWWAQSQGVRSQYLKENIAKQRETVKHKQLLLANKLALQQNKKIEGKTAKPIDTGAYLQRQRDLKCQEQSLGEQEIMITRESEIRAKSRERFLNVKYVHNLLVNLLSDPSIVAIRDPMSASHYLFRRLAFLIGDKEVLKHMSTESKGTIQSNFDLPYELSLTPPSLTIGSLSLVNNRIAMWCSLFGQWINEPVSIPQREPSRSHISPFESVEPVLWGVVKSVFLKFSKEVFRSR